MVGLASGAVHASEPVAESMPVAESPAPVFVRDLGAPPPAVASLSAAKAAPELKPEAKKTAAKKISKSMLSRSARSQLVLAAKSTPVTSKATLAFLDGDDADSDSDDLDMHRFFSRPKVVKVDDPDADDDPLISDHVRLRLFMARQKAVEAHAMAMAAKEAAKQAADQDDSLSDGVKLRLFMARMAAVQAHQKKYS